MARGCNRTAGDGTKEGGGGGERRPRLATARVSHHAWWCASCSSNVACCADPRGLAGNAGIDVFVELIGGADGFAKAAVETALQAGKSVVTANKALLARHGTELANLAEKSRAALNFEA